MTSWTRLDRIATVQARIGWKALTADEYVDEGFAFLATPNIKDAAIDFENVNFISKFRFEESPELKLRLGDVLLAKDGSTLGITNCIRELPRPATVNGSIAVLRPFAAEPRFLMYWLRGHVIQAQIQRLKDGMGVPHLFQQDIRKLEVPALSEAKQRRIADFLDDRVDRIDRIIAARRVQARLTNSLPWAELGGLLASASQVPLRRAIRSLADGPFGSAFSSSDYVDVGPAVIRLGNIGFDQFRGADLARVPSEIYDRFPNSHVRPGDLLIASLGDANNHAGRACVAPADLGAAMVKGKCFVVKANHEVATERYLSALLSSPLGADSLVQQGTGATRSMLNFERLLSTRLPMPIRREQDAILLLFEDAVDQGSRAAVHLTRSINFFTEYKRSLITAAVTGQIDVTATGSGIPG